MANPRSQIGIIFLTVLIDLIGFGIVIPVLPLYAKGMQATPLQIGLLVGVFSFAQFLFSPIWGALSDRFGRRPILIISSIGTAAGFFLMGAANTLALLFFARILDGLSGGNISTAQAYIADITPPEDRSKRMGLIGAAFGLGFMIGPALGGIASQWSLSAPFYLAGTLALLNLGLIIAILPESLKPEDRSHRRPRQTVADVFRHAHGSILATVMLTYFFSITGFAIMTTLYALFNQVRFGYDAQHTGYIFALIGFIGVVIQGGLLRRLLKSGNAEAPLAIIGAAILALSLFALPYVGGLSALLAVSALIAVGNSFLTPTLNGLASRHVDASWQGRAAGLMQSAGSLGRTVGPVLGGWLLTFDLARPTAEYARTPLWTGGVLLTIAFALALLLLALLRRHAPLAEPASA